MGYFELLRLSKPETNWPESKTTFLRFKRGRVSEKEGGQLAKQLRIEIEALVGGKIKKHFLFEGLSEAITNAGQHAYRTVSGLTLKQWWLSASFDSENRRLSVMFFDQGEGIPKTLPRADFFETIKDLFAAWSDSEKIKAAMEVGRTSTKHSERGKGLQNLLEFAKWHREGQLSIYSLRGMFRQTFGDGVNDPCIMLKNFENSVGGTLIEWSVKLD